ncbi:MAG: hypothetical protein IJ831_09975 [Spirochaetales bacterium]|nr:hypothetical protein [Spirochaetales bacterium]
MQKLEIIMSAAIDNDFMHRCEVRNIARFYTKIDNVLGKGNQNPKLGNEVWPQFNVHYTIVVRDEEVDQIRMVINSLRRDFPDDGVACFITPCEEI